MPDSSNNQRSSPTPSSVHFHAAASRPSGLGNGGGDPGAEDATDGIACDRAQTAGVQGAVHSRDDRRIDGGEQVNNEQQAANGVLKTETDAPPAAANYDKAASAAAADEDVMHVRIVLPSSETPVDHADGAAARDRRLSSVGSEAAPRVAFADTVIDVNGGSGGNGPAAPQHKVKSVSHWYDSRISVEMHLALYIEDLMLLAPGVAGEKETKAAAAAGGVAGPDSAASKAPGESREGSTVVGASTTQAGRAADSQTMMPVDFDEDQEPDITLQHVLAGVDYLLHTRIIGSGAGGADIPQADGQIAEGDEEDDGDEEEQKSPSDKAAKSAPSPGMDASGMPAPLASAPTDALHSSATPVAPFLPKSSGAHPYFYFVSLDLALCDDMVTALCYHMRRAEKKWSLRPKASAEAIKALELFEGFFRYVYSFRCCVAARPASYLREALKVGRHLRSPDVAHRKMVVRLLLMLTSECARIDKWEELVDADDQSRVREMLTSTEMRKLARKLAGQQRGDMERESSMSRQASFKTSRTGVAGADHAHDASGVLQVFPAFYSTRHGQLLPPKGALFDVEPHRLLKMFKTDLEKGLCSDEILERQKMYGKNELPPPHEASFLQLVWAQLKDFIILVLIAAAVISAGMQDWKAMGVLLFVVLINVVIGLVQEYRSGQALKALNSFNVPQAQLLRDGVVTMHPASELVPGDMVILDEGANVPADLRLLQVSQLATIEAILTGESLPVLKSTAAIKPRGRRYLPVGDRVNMAFMSTLVSKGRAVGLVVNTGATTEVGRIYSALNASAESESLTPLQRKLATLGKWLVLISIVSCALVVAVGLGRDYGTEIVEVGVSLAVSVIPEGLVTVVTLTMAVGVTRMAERKAIVRNLPAVETLGSVTTICSDKTGTLTEGKMRTESMWVGAQTVAVGGAAADPASASKGNTLRFVSASKSDMQVVVAPVNAPNTTADGAVAAPAAASAAPATVPAVTALLDESHTVTSASDLPAPLQWHNMVCSMNNNATIKIEQTVDSNGVKGEEEVMVGDATEVALLRASQQAHCGVAYWETTFGLKRVLEFAFDSDRKRMSIVLELPAAGAADALFVGVQRPANATHVLLVKGAPEAVLNRSVAHLASSGNVHAITPLSDPVEDQIEHEGSLMAGKGMRVLATAFRFLEAAQVEQFRAGQDAANKEAEAAASKEAADAAKSGSSEPALSAADLSCAAAESDLCFIGLAGIMDPPRVEVADAIKRAHGAGIRVCMITGDHYDTALAIAKQIGIFSEENGDRAMNGDALAVLTEEQLAALNPFPVVFSRVSPDNKLKLVKSLQRRGEVAAMTGDGVNDAPAIRQADVGIAMGLGGTEVTRQAADIVLSDDNFTTIVFAVEEGRRILDNIVKFLVYLLSCNGAEVMIMLLSVCAGWEVPYLPLMILWANIFVDIPPSLALGLEKVDAQAMRRAPRSNKAGILGNTVLMVMAYDAAVMALIVLVNYWHMFHVRELEIGYARSFAFLLLAIIHLLHAWVSSSLTGTIFRRDLISNNPSMLWALIVSLAFVIAGHYVPGLNDVLELEPIHGLEWGVIFINLAVFIILVEARKYAMRHYGADQEEMVVSRQHKDMSPPPANAPGAKLQEIEMQ